jgi:bacteriorhodopsin
MSELSYVIGSIGFFILIVLIVLYKRYNYKWARITIHVVMMLMLLYEVYDTAVDMMDVEEKALLFMQILFYVTLFVILGSKVYYISKDEEVECII